MLRATVILVTNYLTMKKASKIWKERYGGRYHYTNFRMDKDVFLKLKRMKGLMKWNYFFKEIVNIKQKFENEINLFLKHCENKKAQHRCSTCVVLGDLKLRLYEKRIETNAQQKTEYTSFNCYMNFPTGAVRIQAQFTEPMILFSLKNFKSLQQKIKALEQEIEDIEYNTM